MYNIIYMGLLKDKTALFEFMDLLVADKPHNQD